MIDHIFVEPGMSPRDIVNKVRSLDGVCLTSVSMRDAGQSDFKNRFRLYDIKTLAPIYNKMGLFSAECHGGARWHVGVMNRKECPFEEVELFRQQMPRVLLQTLVRETNLWGYRPYPPNVIKHVVSKVDIDIWRCFSFLNDIRNMQSVAEVVMNRGRLFEPAVCFTQTDWTCTDWTCNSYYLKVVDEIVSLCAGTDEIILCIKDMAGLGSPQRIGSLVDVIKQKYPELVIHYHRHTTDGLAIPALLAAAKAGASILDVQEDPLVRFYGHSPILAVRALLEESGIPVHLNLDEAEAAVQKVREWIGHYEWAESPFKGYDYRVIKHRMPGGAFPSSFEQAEKGGFLHLMPEILTLMSLYNQMINYFDVTPGSQITWATCSGIVNRYVKERGEASVKKLISLLKKFVEEKGQDIEQMDESEQEELYLLFRSASRDFKNLLLGKYGKLPAEWPADWVYKSSFGDRWMSQIKGRSELSPLEMVEDEDLDKQKSDLAAAIGREPGDNELILYLMHPKDAVDFIHFRDKYGEAPLVLPTDVWRKGLSKSGCNVEFQSWGKPCCVELVSVGNEHEGYIHVVMRVNNQTRVYSIRTPRAKVEEMRMATGPGDVGATLNGNLWRIGNPQRGTLQVGAIVRMGEEIANIEAMKMENGIYAPFDGQIIEVCAKLNDIVHEGQLLFVLEKQR
ncbi:MAG TPA: biotin/lipoyl-containing protein [Candidatus Limnocylindrales bacterium]|nr:biotin/lipoyl-containing protein [Candidatus Limnocylindrales bacterium]